MALLKKPGSRLRWWQWLLFAVLWLILVAIIVVGLLVMSGFPGR